MYTDLGPFDINGRTIKNPVRTAASFTKVEGQSVGIRHLYVVIEINLGVGNHTGDLVVSGVIGG